MVRFSQLTHIQMLHGDSDKASSYNPVTAMFDKVYVAGQAGIDRYAANGVYIDPAKFEIVGRPQVEKIRVAQGPIADLANQTVMYATTWSGLYTDMQYSSLAGSGSDRARPAQSRRYGDLPPAPTNPALGANCGPSPPKSSRCWPRTAPRPAGDTCSANWPRTTMSLFECFDLLRTHSSPTYPVWRPISSTRRSRWRSPT